MTILFQIPAQKYPNKAFLVPNLRIFIFVPKFVIKQIQWYRFQIPEHKAFLVTDLTNFIFARNFAFRKIGGW